MSLGDVKAGAFAVLRVDFVLSGDVLSVADHPILWTGFPAQNAHQGPFFSFGRLFLFFLWTFAFKSKGSSEILDETPATAVVSSIKKPSMSLATLFTTALNAPVLSSHSTLSNSSPVVP